MRKCFMHPRNRCARKIERMPLSIEHYFDDIGVENFCGAGDQMRRCGERTIWMRCQMRCNCAYQIGREQRFIALHVKHDGCVWPGETLRHFSQTVGAATM